MKFFNSHLSAQQIADAIDGLIARSAEFDNHLAECAHCAKEYAALEKAIGLMRRDDSSDAPASAFNFAVNLFRTRKTFEPRAESLTQKILATLKLDLSNFAPAFGERSAAVSDERQMLFSAGDYDIDLRIRQSAEGFVIRGQVLGEIEGKCFVRLDGADFSQETPVNEVGAFVFSPVSSLDDLQVSLVFEN